VCCAPAAARSIWRAPERSRAYLLLLPEKRLFVLLFIREGHQVCLLQAAAAAGLVHPIIQQWQQATVGAV
jgi:hypothetical protein